MSTGHPGLFHEEYGAEPELVSRRELAELLGVSEKAIRKAIDCGKILAIDKRTGKLLKEQAISQYAACRAPRNNNRYGRLEIDRPMLAPNKGHVPLIEPYELGHQERQLRADECEIDAEGPDPFIPEESRLLELCLRRAVKYLWLACRDGGEAPADWQRRADRLLKQAAKLYDEVSTEYYGGLGAGCGPVDHVASECMGQYTPDAGKALEMSRYAESLET